LSAREEELKLAQEIDTKLREKAVELLEVACIVIKSHFKDREYQRIMWLALADQAELYSKELP
jgi:hypothetical protein